MRKSESTKALLLRIWAIISAKRKKQFIFLLLLTLVSLIFEIVSIGAVLPFIGILTQPEKVFNYEVITPLKYLLNLKTPAELILPITILFGVLSILAGVLRILLLWFSTQLGNLVGADLSIEIYRKTLYQPYKVHIARSSSEIISGITQKVGITTSILISIVTLITSLAFFIGILATIIVVDPFIAIISFFCFGISYAFVAWLTRSRLIKNSKLIAYEQTHVVKSLQEGLGAIRDVLLDGTQNVYSSIYQKAFVRLQRASGENIFMSQSPRYGMESLGMALIAGLVLVLSYRPGGIGAALPVLGLLALGAQKLLPIMQQVYANWSTVIGNKEALVDVVRLVNQPLPTSATQPEPEPLNFETLIHLNDIWFRYSNESPWILQGVNIVIPKGARVGFIGTTGSGKSTLLDIVMGLLEPSVGKISVDEQEINSDRHRSWQRTISHVPQNIFLSDSTIAQNIAFGVPQEQIDMIRVQDAARKARIAEFVEKGVDGYEAMVGERGVKLSGGQRQRIGIARALYKQSQILIFDEATSALDNETEKAVMTAIEELSDDLTILIIAHRLTTLKDCDLIFRIDQGMAYLEKNNLTDIDN